MAHTIRTGSGYRWKDSGGLHWASPSDPEVRDYLVGLMVELAGWALMKSYWSTGAIPPSRTALWATSSRETDTPRGNWSRLQPRSWLRPRPPWSPMTSAFLWQYPPVSCPVRIPAQG